MEFGFREGKMLDVNNLGQWVTERNFKVENFLRKHLHQTDTGCTRYYETCVIERNGSLLLKNIILTDQALHFTENPPKTLSLSIPLSDIQDVSQVADRKTLIKGGNNNAYICQHIRLVYKVDTKAQRGTKKSSRGKEIKIKIHPHDSGVEISQSSLHSSGLRFSNATSPDSTCSSSSFSSRSVIFSAPDESWSADSRKYPQSASSFMSDPETSAASSDMSRQSSSLDHSYIPMAIYYAYEPIIAPPSPRRSRIGMTKSSSMGLCILNVNASYAQSLSEESVGTLSSSPGSLKVISDLKESHNSKPSSRRSDLRNFESRSEYSDAGRDSPLFKKVMNGKSMDYKRSRGLKSSRGVVDSRASFLVEQRPSRSQDGDEDRKSTKSEAPRTKKDGQDQQEKRRPRSVDISQLSNLRKKILGKVFGGMKDGAVSKTSYKGSTPDLLRLNNRRESLDVKQEDRDALADGKKILVLNVYLYQPKSGLLNELFLFWNRHSLNCMMLMEEDTNILGEWDDGKLVNCPSLRAAEKMYTKLSLRWSPFDNSVWTKSVRRGESFPSILSKLGDLDRALRKYDHLKRLCWKIVKIARSKASFMNQQNWDMLANLLGILKLCTTRQDLTEEEEDHFLEKVSAFAVIMDIFRLMYEACGTRWFVQGSKSDTFTENNNDSEGNYYQNQMLPNTPDPVPINLQQVTSFLLKAIFESSIIPHAGIAGRIEMIEIVCDPQKFAGGHWCYRPDSKAIKLITMGHNASVALLHEILSIVHFSSKDNERVKFMSHLQNRPMEAYAKLSVTQVMNLLWSNGRTIGPSQAVLLYRHVSVLKTLLVTVPELKSFVQDTFCEEFRYFVHGEIVNKKISDRYPLKPKLLATCEELRQEIIGK